MVQSLRCFGAADKTFVDANLGPKKAEPDRGVADKDLSAHDKRFRRCLTRGGLNYAADPAVHPNPVIKDQRATPPFPAAVYRNVALDQAAEGSVATMVVSSRETVSVKDAWFERMTVRVSPSFGMGEVVWRSVKVRFVVSAAFWQR